MNASINKVLNKPVKSGGQHGCSMTTFYWFITDNYIYVCKEEDFSRVGDVYSIKKCMMYRRAEKGGHTLGIKLNDNIEAILPVGKTELAIF